MLFFGGRFAYALKKRAFLPESGVAETKPGTKIAAAMYADQLRQVARDAGGHATLFIAANEGDTGAIARFDSLKPPLDRIHRQLKAQFDPAGIFNPNRMSQDF